MNLTSPTASASVQVVVRLRPLNEKEKKHGTLPVVSASTNEKTVTVIKGQGARQVKSSYKFDNVFTAFSSQEEVFEATLQPVIRDVLMGFESTVFAYGQTGTGKTHTMEGDLSRPELHGVIPRSAAAIFNALNQPNYLEWTVSCSFLEIYNEDLCDLLVDNGNNGGTGRHHPHGSAPKRQKLGIMEGKNGPFCRGLSESTVNSAEDVLTLMRQAQKQRQVGETNMNKQSSRSHCIFTLKVQAKRKVEDGSILEVGGKLHCVDLAGSECAKSANLEKGNEEQAAREMERKNINQSLLTLGRVVSMLKEQSQGKKKNVRIPYRDSKLTRILQESLGGRCKTCLIATVSPSVTAIEESMSTLNYAQAANGIINKPITSSLMMSQGGSAMNDMPASSGETHGGTVEHWQEMECRLQYMQSQVEEAQHALARKHLQQQELVERAEIAENARNEAIAELNKAKAENDALQTTVTEQEGHIDALSTKLSMTEQALRESNAVLRATQKTERNLTGEARQLISILHDSIDHSNTLYEELSQKHLEEKEKKEASRVFEASMMLLLVKFSDSTKKLQELQNSSSTTLIEKVGISIDEHRSLLSKQESALVELRQMIDLTMQALADVVGEKGGIRSSFDTTTSQVRDCLTDLNHRNNEHSNSIGSSSKTIAERLIAAGVRMKEMEVNHIDLSAHMLKRLESDVMNAKENLSLMINSMTESLSQAQVARDQSRQQLRSMLEDGKHSNLSAYKNVSDDAENEMEEVRKMIDLLSTETKRHDTIEMALKDQRDQLNTMSSEQIEHLGRQADVLCQQRKGIEQNIIASNKMCEEVMNKIMRGVQDLVKSQFTLIMEQQEGQAKSLLTNNAQLNEANIQIKDAASEMVKNTMELNEKVQSNDQMLRAAEQQLLARMEKTSSVFNGIGTTCAKEMESVLSAYSNSVNCIDLGAAHDVEAVREMTTTMTDQGSKCGAQLASQILQGAQSRSADLSKNSKETFSFIESELSMTTEALHESIENVAVSLRAQSEGAIESILEKLSGGEKAIHCSLAQHHKHTTSLQEHFGEYFECSRSIAKEHESNLNTHQQDVTESIRDSSRTAHSEFKACEEGHLMGTELLNQYAHRTIQVEKEVSELLPSKDFLFSEQLSSTPASAVIIQELSKPQKAALETEGPTEENVGFVDKENEVETVSKIPAPIARQKSSSSIPVLREQTNEIASGIPSSDLLKRRTGESIRSDSTRPKRVKTRR